MDEKQPRKAVITTTMSDGSIRTVEITDPRLVRRAPKKESCHDCHWVESVPGSTHKKCIHPDLKADASDPMAELMALFASVGRVPPVKGYCSAKSFGIELDDYGVKNGWASWPYQFDPIWVKGCNRFDDQRLYDIAEELGRKDDGIKDD